MIVVLCRSLLFRLRMFSVISVLMMAMFVTTMTMPVVLTMAVRMSVPSWSRLLANLAERFAAACITRRQMQRHVQSLSTHNLGDIQCQQGNGKDLSGKTHSAFRLAVGNEFTEYQVPDQSCGC